MNFLRPDFLAWMPLSLIPLIIYLFFKKKLKRIEFSSLFLLNDLAIQQNRRLKIENILLIIARTIIIILLILLFSGLFFGQKIKHFNEKPTRLFIFLDTSPSMQSNNGNFTLQQKAAASIHIIGDNFPDAQIKLVTSFAGEEYFINNKDDIKVIDNIKESPSDKSLKQILKEADSFFLPDNGDPSLFNNHLFLLTDGILPTDSTVDTKTLTDPSINRFFISDYSNSTNEIDFSIDSVKISSDASEQVVNCYFSISSDNNSNNSIQVELFGESSKLSEQRVHFENQHAITKLNLTPGSKDQKVFFKLSNDKNNSNNYFYFKLPGNKKKTVLLAGDSLSYSFKQLKIICNLADVKSAFQIKSASLNQLSQMNLADFDIVLITALNDLSAYTTSLLNDYLASGKSLFVIAGTFDPGNYNSLVQKKLNLPIINGIISSGNSNNTATDFYPITYINNNHSLLKNVFSDGYKINSVEIYKYLKSAPNNGSDSEILLSAADQPLLISSGKQNSKSIFLATSIEKNWSNLGENGLLVPLIYNGFKYLTRTQNDQINSHFSNGPIDLKQPNLTVYSPDNKEIKTDAEGFLRNIQFPGFYSFTNAAGEMDFVAFNNNREYQNNKDNLLINSNKNFTNIKTTDLSSADKIFGRDSHITIWLLISLFLFLCTEMWLSRRL